MKFLLFDKHIELKSYSCSLNDFDAQPIETPYVNLYVRFKGCNANCVFCEYKDSANEFDFEKFDETLSKLKSQIKVNKISLTGGEPTFNLKKLYKVIEIIKKHFPDTFMVLNTNGFKLLNICQDDKIKYFDSISISRHHYIDKINNEIFGFNAISKKDLKMLTNKEVFHLSCNLIKKYIDKEKEIYKYLDFANYLKIYDVGFVSLMKVNDYCNNNFIDFSSLNLNNNRMFKTKEWKNFDKCKCNNYLYIPKELENEVIKVYSRCSLKPDDASNLIVWDGENLKHGFNGLTLN